MGSLGMSREHGRSRLGSRREVLRSVGRLLREGWQRFFGGRGRLCRVIPDLGMVPTPVRGRHAWELSL